MSQVTKIQIPLNKTLRLEAEAVAKDYGYSSLQEVVRVFLTGFANKQVQPTFVSCAVEVLTPEQDTGIMKRVKEVHKAIEEDEVYTATSGEELLKHAKSLR